MRYVVDILVVILLLIVGSGIKSYGDNFDYQKLANRLESFESDVIVNNVLDNTYVPNKVYVKQVEENSAGRVARNVSTTIENLLESTLDFTNELFYQALK